MCSVLVRRIYYSVRLIFTMITTTRSVPILVLDCLYGDSYHAELQTYIQDDTTYSINVKNETLTFPVFKKLLKTHLFDTI